MRSSPCLSAVKDMQRSMNRHPNKSRWRLGQSVATPSQSQREAIKTAKYKNEHALMAHADRFLHKHILHIALYKPAVMHTTQVCVNGALLGWLRCCCFPLASVAILNDTVHPRGGHMASLASKYTSGIDTTEAFNLFYTSHKPKCAAWGVREVRLGGPGRGELLKDVATPPCGINLVGGTRAPRVQDGSHSFQCSCSSSADAKKVFDFRINKRFFSIPLRRNITLFHLKANWIDSSQAGGTQPTLSLARSKTGNTREKRPQRSAYGSPHW